MDAELFRRLSSSKKNEREEETERAIEFQNFGNVDFAQTLDVNKLKGNIVSPVKVA